MNSKIVISALSAIIGLLATTVGAVAFSNHPEYCMLPCLALIGWCGVLYLTRNLPYSRVLTVIELVSASTLAGALITLSMTAFWVAVQTTSAELMRNAIAFSLVFALTATGPIIAILTLDFKRPATEQR